MDTVIEEPESAETIAIEDALGHLVAIRQTLMLLHQQEQSREKVRRLRFRRKQSQTRTQNGDDLIAQDAA